MPSGRKLSQEQVDAILRLAGELNVDGEYLLTYEQIAERLCLHRHSVYRVIRQAAVRLGKLTAWRQDQP